MTQQNSVCKVALVTGAASGIGRYLATHLAAQGYQVIGCSRRELDPLPEEFTYIVTDVTDEQAVQELMQQIRKQYARLDALINCAGQASMNHALLTPKKTFDELLSVNVTGTFLVCREAAKLMKKNSLGRIINFSSTAVPLQIPGEAAYIASKSAVSSLSQVLAYEFASLGITVNVIGPGPTDTKMLRGVPDAAINNLLSRTPSQRMTRMADISNAVDFFLHQNSGAISGQVLYLGGSA